LVYFPRFGMLYQQKYGSPPQPNISPTTAVRSGQSFIANDCIVCVPNLCYSKISFFAVNYFFATSSPAKASGWQTPLFKYIDMSVNDLPFVSQRAQTRCSRLKILKVIFSNPKGFRKCLCIPTFVQA
jgi:hypothetical protein